jgi:uncharacterized protein RhaS with RHS repeats
MDARGSRWCRPRRMAASADQLVDVPGGASLSGAARADAGSRRTASHRDRARARLGGVDQDDRSASTPASASSVAALGIRPIAAKRPDRSVVGQRLDVDANESAATATSTCRLRRATAATAAATSSEPTTVDGQPRQGLDEIAWAALRCREHDGSASRSTTSTRGPAGSSLASKSVRGNYCRSVAIAGAIAISCLAFPTNLGFS